MSTFFWEFYNISVYTSIFNIFNICKTNGIAQQTVFVLVPISPIVKHDVFKRTLFYILHLLWMCVTLFGTNESPPI